MATQTEKSKRLRPVQRIDQLETKINNLSTSLINVIEHNQILRKQIQEIAEREQRLISIMGRWAMQKELNKE